MLHTAPLRLRTIACISIVAGTALMAGCAQERPASYYESPHESTLSDAQNQAQGRRGSRAPSQLQVGFGETDKERARRKEQAQADDGTGAADVDADQAGTSRSSARPLLEARTFLGTVPCMNGDANCPPSRITLTFAPSGEWRSRTQLLGGSEQPIVQQGCWSVTGTDPLRIALLTANETTRASFAFVNDTLLRITTFNDVRPLLDYHLTRQADVDPIDELASRPALACE